MVLVGRILCPSLYHSPVTSSMDTSHMNTAFWSSWTYRSSSPCSTSSSGSVEGDWKIGSTHWNVVTVCKRNRANNGRALVRQPWPLGGSSTQYKVGCVGLFQPSCHYNWTLEVNEEYHWWEYWDVLHALEMKSVLQWFDKESVQYITIDLQVTGCIDVSYVTGVGAYIREATL